MRTVTFGQMTLANGKFVVSQSVETHEVVASFTSEDYIQNAAHSHMSPTEARELAMQLIVYANKIDPL